MVWCKSISKKYNTDFVSNSVAYAKQVSENEYLLKFWNGHTTDVKLSKKNAKQIFNSSWTKLNDKEYLFLSNVVFLHENDEGVLIPYLELPRLKNNIELPAYFIEINDGLYINKQFVYYAQLFCYDGYYYAFWTGLDDQWVEDGWLLSRFFESERKAKNWLKQAFRLD